MLSRKETGFASTLTEFNNLLDEAIIIEKTYHNTYLYHKSFSSKKITTREDKENYLQSSLYTNSKLLSAHGVNRPSSSINISLQEEKLTVPTTHEDTERFEIRKEQNLSSRQIVVY